MNTNTNTNIPVTDLKPGDIFEMEYGDYDNWVTARCIAINQRPNSYFDVEIVFEYVQENLEPITTSTFAFDVPQLTYAHSSNTVKLRKRKET